MDHNAPTPLQVQTIRATYAELGRRVHVALRTQIGDAARLNAQRVECFQMLGYVEQVRPLNRATVDILIMHDLIMHNLS